MDLFDTTLQVQGPTVHLTLCRFRSVKLITKVRIGCNHALITNSVCNVGMGITVSLFSVYEGNIYSFNW
jgi:hypothetical protein